MGPVRIKYYGMFWITRRGYLIATALAGLFALVVWLIVWSLDLLPPWLWPWDPPPKLPPNTSPLQWLGYHYSYLIVLGLVGEAIDVFVMMRKFAQKEAEQRAKMDELDLERFGDHPASPRSEKVKKRAAGQVDDEQITPES